MKEDIILQTGEEIVPIQGYEGLYSITSFGRVWSHEKIRRCNKGFGIYKGKFLKPGLNKKGYSYVILCKNSKKKTFKPHRLVARHYILNPLNDPEVNHKDGVKTNNHKDNLEWCTDQGNKNHAMKNGLYIFKKSSIFYGVYFHKGLDHKKKPWRAQTTLNKKQMCVGYFKTEIEAAKAYNDYVVKHNLDRSLNKI